MNKIEQNLSLLFSPNDNVYLCGAHNGERYEHPRLIAFDNYFSSTVLPEHQFYSINPIGTFNKNIKPDGTRGSYRASINVTEFRNFLLESDTLFLSEQMELIDYLNEHIPIRLATFSGGKSVHMTVSVADTLIPQSAKDPVQLYKQVWQGLHDKADALTRQFLLTRSIEAPLKIFDSATKDPARLSRLPGAMRGTVEQEVLHRGALVVAEDLLALTSEIKLRQYDNAVKTVDTELNIETFERKLKSNSSLSFLRDRLEYPDRWTSNANMYTEMFKYALWCLDATSVPFSTLDAYLQKKVYPSILAKGYPRDPRIGVLAAYQYKGLL